MLFPGPLSPRSEVRVRLAVGARPGGSVGFCQDMDGVVKHGRKRWQFVVVDERFVGAVLAPVFVGDGGVGYEPAACAADDADTDAGEWCGHVWTYQACVTTRFVSGSRVGADPTRKPVDGFFVNLLTGRFGLAWFRHDHRQPSPP